MLTDDVLGVGSRRAVLSEFEATASAMRQQALFAAGDSLAGSEALMDLPPAADSMTYNAAQEKKAQQSYAESGFSHVTQTLDQLTLEQRAAVVAIPTSTDRDGVTHTPDLAGQIIVQEVPTLEMLVPTVNGPVDPGLFTTLYALFQPSPPALAAPKDTAPSPANASGIPAQSLAALIKPIQARAVLSSPHTVAEVQDLVTVMKKLGLNQLWLPIALTSQAPSSNPSSPALSSILTLLSQAVQATKGTDIAVYAVVDLLVRSRATPADAADLTLLGRTSTQAQAARAQREALVGPSPYKPALSLPVTDGVAVSPFSAAVGRELLAVAHTLAATPGLAGLVWRATATPGYDENEGPDADRDFTSLGYTQSARLAFLRKEHVDPLDLFPVSARRQANTSLPNFDDAVLEQTMQTKWRQFRSDADQSLLWSLFGQVATGGNALPAKPILLVQQRGGRPRATWYGSWDGPNAPLPTFRSSVGVPVAEKVQARAQSKFTVVDLPLQSPLVEAAILNQWSGPLQSIGKNHSWDGFVLDCQPELLTP